MDFGLIQSQRSSFPTAVTAIQKSIEITHLPTHFWADRTAYYLEGWKWFSGDALNETVGKTNSGEAILRFPLQIGIRNICRKHVSFLFGEVTDSPIPQVRTIVVPKKPFFRGEKPTEEMRQLAFAIQQTVNEIWVQSAGRSIEQENALLAQFLGGSVFQVKYVPYRKELRIPIIITPIPPDWFFPVWSEDDKYGLLEAFVVYNVSAATAQHQYGVKAESNLVTYVEHWTREGYSIYIDGKPLVLEGITYENRPNPFGIVPFAYLPHLREGSFFGNGILDDLVGILKEYNARLSDQGLAIKKNTGRKKYVKNINSAPTKRSLPDNDSAVDLGMGAPGLPEPTIEWEEPIEFREGFTQFTEQLEKLLWREAHLSELGYGENEGSQRSAIALASQMWPSTAHARQERTFWNDGKIHILKIILAILVAHPELQKKLYQKVLITADYPAQIDVYLDWMPQVPRDRESQLNELILRLQANAIPLELALEEFGDIQDVDWAIEQIHQEMVFKSDLGQKPEPSMDQAPTQTEQPVATTGAGENE